MENTKTVDEIIKYYMNPKSYPNSNRTIIEDAIRQIDGFLIDGEPDKTNGLMDTLFAKYTSEGLDAPINATIYKTRADEQGLSATRGYREIYFNEIVQNANDNTYGNDLDIILSKTDNDYEMTFKYNDRGFSIENIVGFFDTEIHTKRDNLSATGKHGVGIKSLFYFVDYMKIESNVIIEFNIKTKIEDGIEKILKVKSEIKKNEDWHKSSDKKTLFTIRFPEKESYGEFNVSKLKNFINLCLQDYEIHNNKLDKYFYGLTQDDLIFDVRGLLFTDKNKGKQNGIKKLGFYKEDIDKKLFEIICLETKTIFEKDGKIVSMAEIKYSNEDESKLSYLMFTKEGNNGEQNFSVAFPVTLQRIKRRYYETYYIPNADECGVNILVNSKYSNVARTKLTDDDNKKEEIKEKIENMLVDVYRFMTSEHCATSVMGRDISVLFHKLLLLDDTFVRQCYDNNINNKFLLKYKDDTNVDKPAPYIVYKRNEKEEFEKKLIGQRFSKDESVDFFNQYILQKDSIKYDENVFISEICEIYLKAFNEQSQEELRTVLNVAGKIRDLIYYRIHKKFPVEKEVMLNDTEVDAWNAIIWDKEIACENEKIKKVLISLSMIGRYKLHNYITSEGEIIGASFYEYLFNQEQDDKTINCLRYPTFNSKQQELFKEQYSKLKNKMLDLLVNKEQEGTVRLRGYEYNYEKGTVAFYGSWDTRARCETYYDCNNVNVYDYYDNYGNDQILNSNSDEFGYNLTELLVKKILEEKEILNHVIEIYDGHTYYDVHNYKIMLASKEYPVWGAPTRDFFSLATAKWFKCKLININFLRHIYVYSWESFEFYVEEFLEKQNILDGIVYKYKNFNLYTYKENKPLFNMDVNDIVKIFQFFYKNDRYKNISDLNYRVHFKINLTGNVQNNLCPCDYYNYLLKQTNKKVYVMQTNSVSNRKKEVMYWNKYNIHIWRGEDWSSPIGEGFRIADDEIVIVHNEKMDYREAVRKVLENIFGKNDILDKCDAFISEDQNHATQGEEYDDLTSNYYEGNKRNQKKVMIKNGQRLSCKALKKIITARGNNDNSCCCCGKQMISPVLVITNNSCEDTNKEYSQIIEVVCKKCEDVLRKSHNKTELIKENEQYFVCYYCDIKNSHQNKKIIYKAKISEGVLCLSKT